MKNFAFFDAKPIFLKEKYHLSGEINRIMSPKNVVKKWISRFELKQMLKFKIQKSVKIATFLNFLRYPILNILKNIKQTHTRYIISLIEF